ncbi:MAG: hypothetical protein COA88_02435 [Kordia sp.]|nr:MAG: hypothetical protein COA88_02435 [Kordia sp.]
MISITKKTIKKQKKMIFKFLVALIILILVLFVYRQMSNKKTDKRIDSYLITNNPIELYKEVELTEHTINRAGCNLHFYQIGDINKPMVLLLHAAFSDHNSFFQQYQILSKNYLVVGMDLRAHGKSQPIGDDFNYEIISEDIKSIIDYFNKDKISLIGVSIGGEIVQEFNYQYPEMLKSVVIVGAVSIFKDPGSVVKALKKASIKGASMFSGERVKRFMARTISDRVDIMARFYTAIQTVEDKSLRKISQASADAYRVIKDYKIKIPVLLMHGSDELGFAKTAISNWAKEIPNCKYKIIEGAGHLANQENPNEFNKEVIVFLDTVYGDHIQKQSTHHTAVLH